MRVQFFTTTVTTAGTRVQISNTADKVLWIRFQTRAANTGRMFVGLVDVASGTASWELAIPAAGRPLAELEIPFGLLKDGSVLFSQFYADATVNGEILSGVAILR